MKLLSIALSLLSNAEARTGSQFLDRCSCKHSKTAAGVFSNLQ